MYDFPVPVGLEKALKSFVYPAKLRILISGFPLKRERRCGAGALAPVVVGIEVKESGREES